MSLSFHWQRWYSPLSALEFDAWKCSCAFLKIIEFWKTGIKSVYIFESSSVAKLCGWIRSLSILLNVWQASMHSKKIVNILISIKVLQIIAKVCKLKK